MTSFLQDIRYGFRMLASQPGVTAAAVLSLALGVGANTAVFSLIDAMMLKGLPGVRAAEELVILGPGTDRGRWISDEPAVVLFSHPRYRTLRDQSQTLADLAAVGSFNIRVYVRQRDEESPFPASARLVSGEYFPMLGVRPALGRLLGPDDDRSPGGHSVVVLDHGFWRERFGADPSVIGRAITLGDRAFTVVGVADSRFSGERLGDRPQIYAPLMMQAEIERAERALDDPQNSFLLAFGRLASGQTPESAQSELAVLWRSLLLAEANAQGGEPSETWMHALDREAMTVRSGSGGYEGANRLYDPLWLLFAVTLLVLLIACANVANLLLARSTARRREMGVRVAMGAGRGRLIRQVFTESLLLAAFAGAGAALTAVWSRDALLSLAGVSADEIGLTGVLDWRVLGYTLLAALAAGLLFGTAPAWRAGRADVAAQLYGSRGTVGGFGGKLRSALVVAQAALSLLLLFGAGLFMESLQKIAQAETGMQTESLLSVSLDPRGGGIDGEQQAELTRRLLPELEALPGVRLAAMSLLPVLTSGRATSSMEIPGYEPAVGEDMDARIFPVTAGYFETVGSEILRGRALTSQDDREGGASAVVDQVFVDRFLSGVDPLGAAVSTNEMDYRIVGVVRTAKLDSAREEPVPTLYRSGLAERDVMRGLVVRTEGDPAPIAAAVRAAVTRVEPRMPVPSVQTAERRMENQSREDRMLLQLVSGFGLLALLLAAVGLYGVLSYRVAGRTAEIGLRMAVGADRGSVLRLVLREGVMLAGAGVVIGALAAPLLGRYVSSLLYETSPWNAVAVAAAAAVLLSAALVAALVPSLRAARLSPVAALRSE